MTQLEKRIDDLAGSMDPGRSLLVIYCLDGVYYRDDPTGSDNIPALSPAEVDELRQAYNLIVIDYADDYSPAEDTA